MLNYFFGSGAVILGTSLFSAMNAGVVAELWEKISAISNMLG